MPETPKRVCPSCGDLFAVDRQVCPIHGREMFIVESSRDPRVGSCVDNRYTLLGVLGRGGMGVVYRALQHSMEREVALKLIPSTSAQDETTVKRFHQEAKGASRLAHPNIITLFDFGQTSHGELFLVMELLEGWSLRERMSVHRAVGLSEAVSIMGQVCQAVHYAHARGVIHRDLKPENIFLVPRTHGQSDLVKVIDFGVAKMRPLNPNMAITQDGTICGTPAYMSPEQIMGEELDGRSDVYGLACVLVEMLTGQVPFEDDAPMEVVVAHLRQPPPKLDTLWPDAPPTLVALIRSALDKRREKRPATAAEFAKIFAGVLAGERVAYKRTDPSTDLSEVRAVISSEIQSRRPTEVADSDELDTNRGGGIVEVPDRPRLSPIPVTGSFVGRQVELEELHKRYEEGGRLVTIHGPGGMGKTTLSVRFLKSCAEGVDTFGCSGAWFCDLTEARTVGDVCLAVAEALKVPLNSELIQDATLDQLGHAIAARGPSLIVLDNFEQVVAHGPATVGHWMHLAPEVRFLVTSREILGLLGEMVQELSPLSVPQSLEDVKQSEAVQLFVERARAARPGFGIDEDNASAVAEIVRCLDGIPLAIELAAARVSVLSPQKILERLSNRFALLVGRRRDVKKRQATLREALEWSWDLLDGPERSVLAQVSVFRGGFDLEAAEEIIDLQQYDEPPAELDLVQSLQDKALVRTFEAPELPGELRFGFYESIRLFARDKLEAMGGLEETRRRHTTYYLDTCTTWSKEVQVRGSLSSRRRLSVEMENVTGVLDHALEVVPPTPLSAAEAIGAISVLNPVLAVRGIVGDSLERVEQILEYVSSVEVDHALLAAVYYSRAEARRARGLLDQSIGDYELARDLAQSANDKSREAWCLGQLGLAAFQQGRVVDALGSIQKGLEIYETLGEPLGHGWLLMLLGIAFLYCGQLDLAQTYSEQAAAIMGKLDDPGFGGVVQINLAKILQEKEQYQEARKAYKESMAKLRAAEVLIFEPAVLLGLGRLAWEEDDEDRALAYHERASSISREMGHQEMAGMVAGGLAAIHADRDQLDRAERELAEAEALVKGDAIGSFAATATVHRGHLDLARARRARQEGRPEDAEEHMRIAQSRMEAVNQPLPPSDEYPQGLPPLVMRSDDARFALRLLERAISKSAS